MRRLELRLFGGFDARADGAVVTGFDSQKARALLAFLACRARQPIEREVLASLLWGERSPDSARRNLRQTLHSVRVALGDSSERVLAANNQSVWLRREADLWVDVAAFQAAVNAGLADSGVDPYQLAIAARLYTGDLLAGFYLKDCPQYEEWLVTEQERLRDEAIEALRALVKAYMNRGEYRFGIQYARRLLFIDPLSEQAHRQLMRLYALAGHRPRALAQYEEMSNLLQNELGVDPLEETTELYRSILLEELPKTDDGQIKEPIGPLIPLVGRASSFAELESSWSAVLEGEGRLTVVEGEAGAGKSRLVKSFIDRVTSRRRTIVMRGRSYESAPLVSYQPIAELLVGAFADLLPYEGEILREIPRSTLADLALIAPEIRHLSERPDGSFPGAGDARAERIPSAFREFLELAARSSPSEESVPVILFLDDLQWADQASLDLLAGLLPWIAGRAVWILASHRTSAGGGADKLLDSARQTGGAAERVRVGRLTVEDVQELAAALLEVQQAEQLAGFLWRHSDGLPLALAELINLLWAESLITPAAPGHWHLTADPEQAVDPPERLSDLIHLRVSRLPTSSRRLLAMAAVAGQQFDADLLQIAADEHIKVVETGIELMLEGWLIRQFPRSWSQAGREPDIVLWARGARRGWFEFAHSAIRVAVLDHINPLRKQLMHRDLVWALREVRGEDLGEICETVAFHELAGGDPEAALPFLELSARKAEACGATELAEGYRQRAAAAAAGPSKPVRRRPSHLREAARTDERD